MADSSSPTPIGESPADQARIAHYQERYSYSSMKDAPRDGTPILGWVPTYYQGEGAWVVVLWMGQKGMRDAGWMDNRAWLVTPTHWTPLPPSPDATPLHEGKP